MMTSGVWDRAKAVFQEAIEVESSRRTALVRSRCGSDTILEAEVLSLLAAHDEAGSFAERPAIDTLEPSALLGVPAGTTVGTYRFLSHIGAGGMGDVYRARDTRLGRDVAVKVLPVPFAVDRDRLERLEREARLLASLNDPHICAIYGIETHEGAPALILELVEGPTLAERLRAGPLPPVEAFTIAREIAGALEAAHEKGIVHRDLKPANVKITAAGVVKILDFGLATETGGDAPGRDLAEASAKMLGTASYMSPQQARGQAVDKRADIWAFGCVLYELLTGRQTFAGATVSHTLESILDGDPDWTAVPGTVPHNILVLLQRCLEKDPRLRLRDIGDARLEINEALAHGLSNRSTRPVLRTPRRTAPFVFAALGMGLTLVLALLLRTWMRPRAVEPSMQLSVEFGADASLVVDQYGGGTALIVSPDGAKVAFVAESRIGDRPQLWVRSLTQLQAVLIPGTDGVTNPFFSPDGQWIAFFANRKLKKVPAGGGSVITLCDAPDNRGGDWADDGTIVFAPDREGAGLQRVSASGGAPAPLTTLDRDVVTERWPQVLPGSRAVLITAHNSPNGFEDATVVVKPLPSGPSKVLARGGYAARYLASGHVVYIRDAALFAIPFDVSRLEATGPAVRVLEGVIANAPTGASQFSASRTGSLVFVPGGRISYDASLMWVNRAGARTPLRAAAAYYRHYHFAPDGNTLALDIYDGKRHAVWTYEWARDTLSRLTPESADDQNPRWTPDASRIAFESKRDDGPRNLQWRLADGDGGIQRLTDARYDQILGSWHPSGRFLAFTERHADTDQDLMILPLTGSEGSGWTPGTPTVFLNGPYTEREPAFSPDGRWLAYQSNESGTDQVYVRPFPGPGLKWQVSSDGGMQPIWSPKTHEIIYGSPDRHIMAARYAVDGDSFRSDKPSRWTEGRFTWFFAPALARQNFAVHPDGQRVVMANPPDTQTRSSRHFTLVSSFFDDLRRAGPGAR